jgi:hypothetical protein
MSRAFWKDAGRGMRPVSFRPLAAVLAASASASEEVAAGVSVLSSSTVDRRLDVGDLVLLVVLDRDTGAELKACVVEADRTTAAERMAAENFIFLYWCRKREMHEI